MTAKVDCQTQKFLPKKKIDSGFNCKHWTQEQCEKFLFEDLFDTLNDLNSRNWYTNAKIEKEFFDKLKNMCFFNLKTLYKGVLVRAIEIAKETKNNALMKQIKEIKQKAKKEGLY